MEEHGDLCFTVIDGPLVSLQTDFVTAVYLCMAVPSSIVPQAPEVTVINNQPAPGPTSARREG